MIHTPAGEFNRRVTWQSLTIVNSGGRAVETWTPQGTFWAKVRSTSQGEVVDNKQVQSHTTYEVTMRNVGTFKTKDRLIYGTRTLHIESAVDVEDAHIEWRLICKEVNGQ